MQGCWSRFCTVQAIFLHIFHARVGIVRAPCIFSLFPLSWYSISKEMIWGILSPVGTVFAAVLLVCTSLVTLCRLLLLNGTAFVADLSNIYLLYIPNWCRSILLSHNGGLCLDNPPSYCFFNYLSDEVPALDPHCQLNHFFQCLDGFSLGLSSSMSKVSCLRSES